MTPVKTVDAHFSGDGMLTIESIAYYGQFVLSPNGRYILSWSDADPRGGCGGAREQGEGVYLLFDNKRLILRRRMSRPNDGVVSDIGTFAINDWTFGEGLNGIFSVIAPTGDLLIQQITLANLYNCGISDDGKYAVCQCCRSGCEADSDKLLFFDLGNRTLLWKRRPESGRADRFRFDAASRILYLCYEGAQEYRYSFDGSFLDENILKSDERLGQAREANGYDLYYRAIQQLEEMQLETADAADYGKSEDLLRCALGKGVSPYTAALIRRLLGELAEKTGRPNEAIREYEEALRANAKIGVKKRLAKLKHNMG